jgi:hypothetical protein
MDRDQKIYILMAFIVISGLIGFIIVFNQLNFLGGKISFLSSEVMSLNSISQGGVQSPQNSSSSSGFSSSSSSSQASQGGSAVSSSSVSGETPPVISGIPASIVFYVTSTLNSQSPDQIMITIDNVSKVGSQLTVNFKAYNQNQENGAITPSSLIELFNPTGENSVAESTNGNFSLISPQSSVSGLLMFLINPSQNSAILQVGSPDNPVFYEFNFLNNSYQETVVG